MNKQQWLILAILTINLLIEVSTVIDRKKMNSTTIPFEMKEFPIRSPITQKLDSDSLLSDETNQRSLHELSNYQDAYDRIRLNKSALRYIFLSLYTGYDIIWVIAIIQQIYAIHNGNSATGVSKDFLMINLIGSQIVFHSEQWDIMSDLSNLRNYLVVHLTVYGLKVIFLVLINAIVNVYACDSVNNYSPIGILTYVAFISSQILAYIMGGRDYAIIFSSYLESIAPVLACFPQYYLIYKIKSTKEFCLLAQGMICVSLYPFSILKSLIGDYLSKAPQDDEKLKSQLNWSWFKFFMNLVLLLAVSMFFIQYWYYNFIYDSEDNMKIDSCASIKAYRDMVIPEIAPFQVGTGNLRANGNRQRRDMLVFDSDAENFQGGIFSNGSSQMMTEKYLGQSEKSHRSHCEHKTLNDDFRSLDQSIQAIKQRTQRTMNDFLQTTRSMK